MPVMYRRSLLLAVLCLLVATGATVAAMYHHPDDEIGLNTGGGTPRTQELFLQPGTTPTSGDPTTTVPATTPSTTPSTAPRSTATTARSDRGEPAGCVPGTYVERYQSCRWKPVTIDGRVTDTSGRPLPDMCVRSSIMFDDLLARTDARGRYRLEAPQGGLLLRAEACEGGAEFGWVPGGIQAPPIEAGESGTAPDLVVAERGGVFGQAVDTQGNPVSGVCVHGRVTDAEGRFSIPGLDPGTQQIGFTPSGGTGCPRKFALSHELAVAEVRSGEWAGPAVLVAAFVVDQ